jgi:hypothetical protein
MRRPEVQRDLQAKPEGEDKPKGEDKS